MPHSDSPTPLSRRRLLRRGVMGAATLAVSPRLLGGAAVGSPRIRGKRIGRTPAGTDIVQVTDEKVRVSNIYCEVPYCSKDSRWFVYERRVKDAPDGNHRQLVRVELGTWRCEPLDVTPSLSGTAITHDGKFYYQKRGADGALDLMRVDLAGGDRKKVCALHPKRRFRSLGTVSVDERYYVTGAALDDTYKRFGILLVDLKDGTDRVIDEDPYIWNAHPQFEPGKGRTLMIQHNRGGTLSPKGRIERSVGPEGATLYTLSVPEGKRTTLQIGKPHTTPITGHEAWIGKTGEMLATLIARDAYAPDQGNLVAVRPGQAARRVARGYKFNHLGVSRCGKYFCCDDWRDDYKVVIGSIKTGKTAVVCASQTKPSRGQNTHPHAYLTPDLTWVVFNSNRGGTAQVYAAGVPEGMIASLG